MVCIILLLVLCKTINKSQRARHLVIHTYVYVHLRCLQGMYTWAKQLNLLNPGFCSCGIGMYVIVCNMLETSNIKLSKPDSQMYGQLPGPCAQKCPQLV